MIARMTIAWTVALQFAPAFVVHAISIDEIQRWCTIEETLNSRSTRSAFWPIVSAPAGLGGLALCALALAVGFDFGAFVVVELAAVYCVAASGSDWAHQKIRFCVPEKLRLFLLITFYLNAALVASRVTWFGLSP